MHLLGARPPGTLIAAAVVACLVALLDVVDTVLSLLRPAGTGRFVGTLIRDALLVFAAVHALRRERWAAWGLGLLLLLALVRAAVADEWIEWAGVAAAGVGLVLMALPQTHRWFERPARPANPGPAGK